MTPGVEVAAPVPGRLANLCVADGAVVAEGTVLAELESMKMTVPVAAPAPGIVRWLGVAEGDALEAGEVLCRLEAVPAAAIRAGDDSAPRAGASSADAGAFASREDGSDPAEPADRADRADPVSAASSADPASLARLRERRALLRDAARPQAMARRHATGLRSARENVADLLDAGSFSEFGAFAVAAQRARRSEEDLQRQTPADGLVTGTGTVDGRPCAVMAYDYTVLAGTQGVWNHAKADRLLEVAGRSGLPLVLFAEGGGGRPGDVDAPVVAGLHCTTFARLAALSGQVPLVGIAAGRCFAGNAALLGCCDLIIAVEGASIGLGGPAMIEGGGLGRVDADAVGPVADLAAAGVIDVRVPDEAAAVAVAREWLALVGDATGWSAHGNAQADAHAHARPIPGGELLALRHAVPEARQVAFDPRPILRTVADADSLRELRAGFGPAVVTAVGRLAGRPVAWIASDSRHVGGALDADATDKLTRFLRLADAQRLPVLSFIDTPGFMVGPASERTGMVRRAGDLFVAAAALRVPMLAVMLRRGFGLGAMAMAGGHFHAPRATCAWPCGEFGPMGLEGSVRLGWRRELEAAPAEERQALFDRLLAQAVERGQALNMASHLEVDDVIDPAETRDWLIRQLRTLA